MSVWSSAVCSSDMLGNHAGTHKRLEISQPLLTDVDLAKIRSVSQMLDGAFRTLTVDMTWPASEGADGLERAVERICHEATDAVLADQNILILSDRTAGKDRIAIPAEIGRAHV